MTEHDTTELYRMLEEADEPFAQLDTDEPAVLFDLSEIGPDGDEEMMTEEEFVRTTKEAMPQDQVETIENRIGWDKITRVEDVQYAVLNALDEDQQQFEGRFGL